MVPVKESVGNQKVVFVLTSLTPPPSVIPVVSFLVLVSYVRLDSAQLSAGQKKKFYCRCATIMAKRVVRVGASNSTIRLSCASTPQRAYR